MPPVLPKYYPTVNLPLFHDAPPMHTHQQCGGCLSMQRYHNVVLQRCSGCLVQFYCSSDCQTLHWPKHKRQCRKDSRDREALTRETGMLTAWIDVRHWLEYFDAVLWNAAIAAMELSARPAQNLDHTEDLYVHILHKGSSAGPAHQRFTVADISRTNKYADATARGNALCVAAHELPLNCYGTVGLVLRTTYDCPAGPPLSKWMRKQYSVDHPTAAARSNQNWKAILQAYLSLGARIKFCCKSTPNGCCCGGWCHDDDARVGIYSHKDGRTLIAQHRKLI
ncbi:hypothetical protein DFH06DRAFT_1004987 [Mycena polygramma]|nr:hypothetical protein DFH06DRAFT_1004987 [Mycena polygramma]